jgi:potassium efflux system protein
MLVRACLLLATATALADEPAAGPKPSPTTAAAAPGPTAPAAAKLDPAQAKAEAEGRIKGLPANEKDQTATQKALREVWTERLRLIDDWEKACHEIEHPGPAPDRVVGPLKAETDRRRAMIDQLAKSPETILSELFRLPPEKVDEAKLVEMSKEIEQARAHLKERTAELESLKAKADPAVRSALMRDLGTERDRAHARKSTLPTLKAGLEAAYKAATTEETRRVAREKLVNFAWEAALAEERLDLAGRNLTDETRRGEALDVAVKAQAAQVDLNQAALAAMSRRHSAVADLKKSALRAEASREQARASRADDPIEKFRAQRMAELLGLEAQVLEYEKLLSANPRLSAEDQSAQADHAERDLAELKRVVNENRIGGIVALRLNNDFRRLSRERAMIQRNELADSAAAHAHFENALTEAELSYINDDRDDRFERDAFIETLPASRRAEASAALDAIEAKHRQLLIARKNVLEKLLERAEKTHAQVERRLRILDEQYAFVRTHIFWVRDAEPLGPSTLVQARRDAARIASAVLKLGAESLSHSAWSPVSAEFGFIVAGIVLLPPVIVYTRRRLKAMIAGPRLDGPVVRIL